MLFTGMLLAVTARADTWVVPKGGYSLDVPKSWKIIHADSYPDAPENVCFPRFQGGDCAIDSVVWKEKTKEAGLKAFQERLPRLYAEGTTKQIETGAFVTASGIKGVRFVYEYSRPGFHNQRFHRYIIENSRGQVVCIGGRGDLKRVDEMIWSSLRLVPIKQG